jgi:gliding motility-associated-like protein
VLPACGRNKYFTTFTSITVKQLIKTSGLKKKLHYLAFLVASCLLTLPASAAHIIGGEITYQCLGYTNGDTSSNSRTYVFTMRIYRDCQGSGANFDSAPGGSFTASVTIYRGSSNVPFLTLYLQGPTSTFIDPNPGNPCVIVPQNVCVQQGVYVFPAVDLPISNESYHITYQRCCRNITITNILNPDDSGATYTMELTPAAQLVGNNSPVFSNYPPIVLCAGQPFSVSSAAVDAEGDLLVYELCTPLLGGGLNFNNPLALNGLAPDPDNPPPYNGVNFLAPAYTAQNPLGAASDFDMGTYSGLMTGQPAIQGQFVVGICVSEYRNGILLSTVRRDFQFNVTTCTPTVVADVSEDSLANDVYLFNTCGETTLTFINQSFQAQFIDVFYWEFDINGETEIIDTWNAGVTFPGPGEYEGRLVLNPNTSCGDTAHIRVGIYPGLDTDFTFDYDTCLAGPVQFTALPETNGQEIVEWRWNFGDGNTSEIVNPQQIYGDPGARIATLKITDTNRCTATASRLVPYFPVPALLIVSPSETESCAPASVFFNNLSNPVDDTYEVRWDFGDGATGDGINATHTYEQAGVYDVGLSITSPIGCQTDTIFSALITVTPAPIADFDFSPEAPDFFHPTVQFNDKSIDAWRWYWEFDGPGAYATLPNPTFTFADTGLYEVTLLVTHISGCQDSTSRIVDIKPVNTFHLPNAFTPNDDSVNDIYKPEGFLPGMKQYQMRIWNRWGEMIFESSHPDAGWNGRKNNSGGLAPPGVYLCEVRITGPRGELSTYKSEVVLLR